VVQASSAPLFPMAPLADFLLTYVPLPTLPPHLTSFLPGKTPLSTITEVVIAMIFYLTSIFGIQAFMVHRKPQRLQFLFQAHNAFLSAGSLVLLILILEEILPVWWHKGLFAAMCAKESWNDRMEFYYMVNYYFKYLELLDTIFLAFKKKPLQFLHVFHHSATALLCYTQLDGRTSISWTVISLNLAVHVLMYYYYFATAGGAKIWWKKYLTTMQIVQFIIDLVVVYFGTYAHHAWRYHKGVWPTLGDCAGKEYSATMGCTVLTSYLFLFINFYIQTYKKPAKQPMANGTNIPQEKARQE